MTNHYEYALVLVRAYNARTESMTYFRIGMGWIPSERILTSTSRMQHPITIQHSKYSYILHDVILSQYLYVYPHISYCTHAYASYLHKSKYNILCSLYICVSNLKNLFAWKLYLYLCKLFWKLSCILIQKIIFCCKSFITLPLENLIGNTNCKNISENWNFSFL